MSIDTQKEDEVTLNLKVSPDFKEALKMYVFAKGMKVKSVFQVAFLYRTKRFA